MLDKALSSLEVRIRNLMRPSLFLAGTAFRQYRKRGGTRASVLPDFFIGAQAAIQGWPVLTRDVTRIGGYFQTVTLLSPGLETLPDSQKKTKALIPADLPGNFGPCPTTKATNLKLWVTRYSLKPSRKRNRAAQ